MTNLQENNLKEQENKKIEVSFEVFLKLLELYIIMDKTTQYDIVLDVESSRMHKFPIKAKFQLGTFDFEGKEAKVKELITLIDVLEIISGKLTINNLVLEINNKCKTTMISVTTLNTMLKTLFKFITTKFYGYKSPYNFVMASITFVIQEEVNQSSHTFSFSRLFPNDSFAIFDEHLKEKDSNNQMQNDILKKCNLLQNYENINRITVTLATLNDC